jgi:exonuclease SbcC
MKILHITDSHGTVKAPESRTDIYYLAFLRKLYELKYVIKQNDIKLVIHTGDLFHSPRVSDKFTGQVAEIIKSYNVPVYVVPGNHDIDGYNIDTLDQTKLGLLYKTGIVKELDRVKSPIQLKSQKENLTINISGQEYYKDIDTGIKTDFEMQTNSSADFNILAIHGYLCDKPQNPNIRHTLCQNIVTDADVILSGHFHESFIYSNQDFSVYNPGSLMRVEQNKYNQTHKPQYGILEITKDKNGIVRHSYVLHEFKIAEESDKVFDYAKTQLSKKTLITLDNFKNSISNTNLNNNLNTSIENIINDISNNMAVEKIVLDRSIDIYHDALNNAPEQLEVQSGFIVDNTRKFITSVEINNFQSHESTTIDFKDGLNAIIGESNSGKTSILRAIRWCFDNDPHGSDFITTGKDDCSVTVTFNDMTSITRTRTRNESGTYDVIGKTVQPDGSVSKWKQTYKGFANNIPVEISNIHQMPLIPITKDLSTHLNMMSQLDGPFLVTESPQAKAAIIGRLTGTQVIDLAVKETNKTILSDSKLIKTYGYEREAKQSELLQYSDVDLLQELLNYYQSIIHYCNMIKVLIDNYNSITTEMNERTVVINTLEEELKRLNNKIEIYKTVYAIKSHINSQKEIKEKYNDFVQCKQNINILQKRIVWLSIISSFKSFIEENISKIKIYSTVKTRYERVALLQTRMIEDSNIIESKSNESVILNSLCENYNYIISYVKSLNDFINKANSLKEEIDDVKKSIILYNQMIEEEDNNIQEINFQISEINSNKEKIIIENGICPCCGQKITKKHVERIDNFMKGK